MTSTPSLYQGNPANYKRDLGAYLSPRDLTQLISKAVETPNIDNEHGIPWQVVYGISNNTRAFWSLTSARSVLGYEPQDDSELLYANDIQQILRDFRRTGRQGRPTGVDDVKPPSIDAAGRRRLPEPTLPGSAVSRRHSRPDG